MKILVLLLLGLSLGSDVLTSPQTPCLKHWVIFGCHLKQHFLLVALVDGTVLDISGIRENTDD